MGSYTLRACSFAFAFAFAFVSNELKTTTTTITTTTIRKVYNKQKGQLMDIIGSRRRLPTAAAAV